MHNSIQDQVREKYPEVAVSSCSGDQTGVQAVAQAFGYSAEELASIPADANLGLSCGNPTAFASLAPGEVVLDLGSGGGLDVFLAAKRVGPTGKAIGVDMTPEMIDRARSAALKHGLANVEFHLSTIDELPLKNESVDCVISNCVINLAPDKRAVFREILRVLKPGGRLAISDIALKKDLPPEIGRDLLAYVGCIAGAIPISEYVSGLKAAGFGAVQVVDAQKDLNAYSQVEGQSGCCAPAMNAPALAEAGCCTPAPSGGPECCSPLLDPTPVAETECCTPAPSDSTACCAASSGGMSVHAALADLLRKYDINDFAASVQVFAVKPHKPSNAPDTANGVRR